MKKYMILAILWASITFFAQAQKKNIDLNTDKNWSRLSTSAISDNGQFIYFFKSKSESFEPDSVIIRSTVNSWQLRLSFTDVRQIKFTADNKFVILKKGDTLSTFRLGSGHSDIIKYGVQSFKLSSGGKVQWLAYKLVGINDSLFVKNLNTGQRRFFKNAQEYRFNSACSKLYLNSSTSLSFIDLESGEEHIIEKGDTLRNLVFDNTMERVAYYCRSDQGGEIRYFGPGLLKPHILSNDQLVSRFNEGSGLSPDGFRFSADGKALFYQLKATERDWQPKPGISLQLWSYADNRALSHEPTQFSTNIWLSQNLDSKQPFILFKNQGSIGSGATRFELVRNNLELDERLWNSKSQVYSLVNYHNGETKIINSSPYPGIEIPIISPDENFVVWFDNSDHKYHSYNTNSNAQIVISDDIKYPLYDQENDVPARRGPYGIAGWQKDGSLLVYDQFDIWKLDPSGKKKAVCITNAYGRNEHIMLRRIVNDYWKSTYEIIFEENLILTGFNVVNKQNGFLELILQSGQLKKGIQGNFLYTFNYETPNYIDPLCEHNLPQKAKSSSQWLVTRMSATESPNLFVTKDFRHFQPMSDIHPEKKFNWLTSELVRWKLPDGRSAEGILYKPENFDPEKKYPVIFHYYEKFSDLLNWFPGNDVGDLTTDIGPGSSILSISNYTSKNYLVFVPNIYYKTGDVSASITASIKSAVEELTKRPYIDSKHLGLQGHSFGAFETLTLITSLNFFAAAQASNGFYNSTAYYNHAFSGGGIYRNDYFDKNQGNLGCTPWDCPEMFLINSPLFHIQNIQTPLLLLHNSGDDNVPVKESKDLFISMRRLSKPVWFLNYGFGDGHQLGGKSSIDFTLRQEAFFDHYLKGAPMPDWMATPDYNVKQLLNSN